MNDFFASQPCPDVYWFPLVTETFARHLIEVLQICTAHNSMTRWSDAVYSMGTLSRSNWNLEILIFEERGNRSTRRKTSRSKDENQQQTQPTYDAESRNRTRLLVGGKCSHHCAIPAPQLCTRKSLPNTRTFCGINDVFIVDSSKLIVGLTIVLHMWRSRCFNRNTAGLHQAMMSTGCVSLQVAPDED